MTFRIPIINPIRNHIKNQVILLSPRPIRLLHQNRPFSSATTARVVDQQFLGHAACTVERRFVDIGRLVAGCLRDVARVAAGRRRGMGGYRGRGEGQPVCFDQRTQETSEGNGRLSSR